MMLLISLLALHLNVPGHSSDLKFDVEVGVEDPHFLILIEHVRPLDQPLSQNSTQVHLTETRTHTR